MSIFQTIVVMAVLIISSFHTMPCQAAQDYFLRLEDNAFIALDEMATELQNKRLILLGELHTNPHHHRMQLAVIEALHKGGQPIALAFEAFQHIENPALARWVSGELPEADFRRIYQKNWGMDWDLYKDIFYYARENKLPMQGLNIPREIVRQVSQQGFNSLSPEQLAEIPGVRCEVNEEYEQFIARALASHDAQDFDFTYFCEAQMVWDSVMSWRIQQFLEQNPGVTLVVIAGGGHAWKRGIPAQLKKNGSSVPTAAILPERDYLPRQKADVDDADYLWLNGLSSLHKKTLYFDQAHGQAFLANKNDPLDLSGLAGVFSEEGFAVSVVSSGQLNEAVLAQTDALVISGPFAPYRQDEIQAIRAWINDGGRLALMLHITQPVSDLLYELGLLHSNGVIHEKNHQIGDKDTDFLVRNLVPHPLTQKIDQFALFGAWAVQNSAENTWLIAKTSDSAWVDLNNNKNFDEGDAQQQLGVLAVGKLGKGEYAVFGDDAIFQNRFLQMENLQLARNLARWLGR